MTTIEANLTAAGLIALCLIAGAAAPVLGMRPVEIATARARCTLVGPGVCQSVASKAIAVPPMGSLPVMIANAN